MSEDLTGSVYSLVVLSSAALAFIQVVRSNLEGEALSLTEGFSRGWNSEDNRPIRENENTIQTFKNRRKEYDTIVNQKIKFNMTLLQLVFGLLPVAAILQALIIVIKIYHVGNVLLFWCATPTILVGWATIVGYLLFFALFILSGLSLFDLKKKVKEMEESIESWNTKASANIRLFNETNNNL